MKYEIKLRSLRESDYEIYKIMFTDRANYQGIKYDFIFENTWKKMMGETMQVWAITNPATEQIYGFCQLDNYNSSTPEIGVDILDDFKNMGFGQACIEMMINHCKQKARFD
jgi:RimJ/RimL family protein N-acetyltransferase